MNITKMKTPALMVTLGTNCLSPRAVFIALFATKAVNASITNHCKIIIGLYRPSTS